MKEIMMLIMLTMSNLNYDMVDIIDTIKILESNKKNLAVGDKGKAYGILQIHKVVIIDINRIYGTTYTHQDAFDEECSEEIFTLYISAGINRFMKKYGKIPSEQNIVRMWNGGIYRGYKYSGTNKYYKKYLKIKRNKKR